MQMIKAGIYYFVLVFGAGFVLGTICVLWVVPKFGTRTAELLEMPLMLAVIILAARGQCGVLPCLPRCLDGWRSVLLRLDF